MLRPVPDVYEALVKSFVGAGKTTEEAQAHIEHLKEQERYILEVYVSIFRVTPAPAPPKADVRSPLCSNRFEMVARACGVDRAYVSLEHAPSHTTPLPRREPLSVTANVEIAPIYCYNRDATVPSSHTAAYSIVSLLDLTSFTA